MLKRIVMTAVLGIAGSVVAADTSNAGIFFRPAPVRRVAARVVLPPYPVARRVVTPAYTPVYGAAVYGAPVLYSTPTYYRAPYLYGGGVSVGVGF